MGTDDEANVATGMVEVNWSGKKLLMQAKHLDEWRDKSFEQREAWVAAHPYVVSDEAPVYHPTFEGAEAAGSDDDVDEDIKKFQKHHKKEPEGEMSDYVVVHFNGKSLLLPRKQLDEWHNQSPEERLDFIKANPDVVIKM